MWYCSRSSSYGVAMVSNKLSAKRHFLVRPKVCKAQSHKASVVGLSLPACKIEPTAVTIVEYEEAKLELSFCVMCEPIGNPVKVATEADEGYFSGPPVTLNCVPIVVYWGGGSPGVHLLTFKIEWWTGALCELESVVTVLPFS